ncbi:ankyrin repeat-containing domain protein [Fusarium oxysporum]|nr:ankyrin repeat-containing domain protein [Fusarium oxysporum]
MPSLDRLPNEVLCNIAGFLVKKYDIASLSRANRHCYDIASPILWKREARSDRPGAIHWAVEHGDINVLRPFTHRPKPRIDRAHKWYNYHSNYYDDPVWRVHDDDHSVDLDASYVLHDMCDCFESGCDDGIIQRLQMGAYTPFTESPAVDEGELEDLHGGNWTPLHVAICHNQYETAKFLLKRGASPVIYQGIDFELEPLAWRQDDTPVDSSRFKLTALHHAAKENMMDLVEFLIDEKYQEDIDVEGPFMGTPLFQAIWYGHWDTVVPYLLQHGADLDKRLIETGLTPLMMACFSRRFDDAARLVDLGSNVTTLSVHQFSILHLILGPRHLRPEDFFDPLGSPPKQSSKVSEAEIIQKFITKGFDVDARETLLGMTPLMVASASCNTDAMQALLEGGANVNAVDNEGLSALARVGETAEGSAILGLYDSAKMLLDAGATLEDSRDEITPLNIICTRQCEPYFNREWDNQHATLAKLLIEHGADPNEKGVATSQRSLRTGGRPEKGDLERLLSIFVHESYDDGKTDFILHIDYAKYGISGPSEGFLVDLLKTALNNQLWTRAADLMRSVPTPSVFRKGLIYRCLEKPSPIADEPSSLIQVLLDRGQDPNELFEGEPPLYYSFKSGSCWRTTPVLVNGGADIHMPTNAMPDGALMYTITHGYQPQTCQLLAKHPHALRGKPERLHRECWSSLIHWEPHPSRVLVGRSDDRVPQLNWTFTSRLISAGLRTDVTTLDDEDVKELVEQAIPKTEVLKVEGRKVLEALDIAYVEPSVSDILNATIGMDVEGEDAEEEEEGEDFEYGSVSDEIDDHSDYYDVDSDGVPFELFPPYMGGGDGDEDEEDENDQGEQDGEDGWGEGNSSDFDDYDDGAPMPIPAPLLFGFLIHSSYFTEPHQPPNFPRGRSVTL